MTYALGLDIGTTYVAAAVVRDGTVETLSLDNYRVSVPSAVFASGDEILYGQAALRRGAINPSGLAREFKRRLGDSVPIVLDGSPYHADRLSALLTAWVVEQVSEQMGGPPAHIVITHPANWTEFQLNLFHNALRDVDLADTSFLSEPAAAATDYAAVTHLDHGEMVLVYDLGGGTFDVALLRYTGDTFEQAIEPYGIERLGGIDFDQALFEHVLALIPDDTVTTARDTVEGAAALAQLRRSVVDAKETLSSDVAVDIPVVLPGHTTSIRVTRHDFERMIEPMIRQTVHGIHHTLTRAHLQPTQLSAVLLVGGSSRIPLIPDLVSKELHLPVRVDAHPKLVVAKGAARHATTLTPTHAGAAAPAAARSSPDAAAIAARRTPTTTPDRAPPPASTERDRSRVAIGALVAVMSLVGLGGAALALGWFDRGSDDTGAATATTVPTADTAVTTPVTAAPTTATATEPPEATDPATTAATVIATTEPPATTAAPPTTVSERYAGPQCPPGRPCIEMSTIEVVDGEYSIEWSADFTPSVSGTHAHFFWDVYEPEQVGSASVDRAPWELTAQQPFVPAEEMRLVNRPADATGICVTPADADHAVIDPASFHCALVGPDGNWTNPGS